MSKRLQHAFVLTFSQMSGMSARTQQSDPASALTVWIAKTLDDFEINDIAALPSLFLL